MWKLKYDFSIRCMGPPQFLRVGFCTLKVVSYYEIYGKYIWNSTPAPGNFYDPPARAGTKSGIPGRGPGRSLLKIDSYGAPCVKLRNIKFCIIFWLNFVQYHILLQFMHIAAICVKLLQFIYIAAICVHCCNLSILQKTLKSPFNCHGDMSTKTVSVVLSLFPWTHVVYWPVALLYWLCSVRLLVWLKHLSYWLNESFKLLLLSYWYRYPLEYQQLD